MTDFDKISADMKQIEQAAALVKDDWKRGYVDGIEDCINELVHLDAKWEETGGFWRAGIKDGMSKCIANLREYLKLQTEPPKESE